MGALLKALKENPVETAMVFVGVMLGLILGIVTILGYSNSELAIGISLEIMAIIAVILFLVRAETSRVERNTQATTLKLQDLELHVEDIRLRSWRLSEVFHSFGQKMPELECDLQTAEQVWILSRTCRRLWSDFHSEFGNLAAKKDGLRLLLLDPEGSALGLTTKAASADGFQNESQLRNSVVEFLQGLHSLCENRNWAPFVRKIDFQLTCTLILINPGIESSVINGGKIYVELATYRAHSRRRPTFVISSERDHHLFCEYRQEFIEIWNEAKDAWALSG